MSTGAETDRNYVENNLVGSFDGNLIMICEAMLEPSNLITFNGRNQNVAEIYAFVEKLIIFFLIRLRFILSFIFHPFFHHYGNEANVFTFVRKSILNPQTSEHSHSIFFLFKSFNLSRYFLYAFYQVKM